MEATGQVAGDVSIRLEMRWQRGERVLRVSPSAAASQRGESRGHDGHGSDTSGAVKGDSGLIADEEGRRDEGNDGAAVPRTSLLDWIEEGEEREEREEREVRFQIRGQPQSRD